MKLLKKLLAAALVGVMALTLLAGCAQSVNEKELVTALNDLHYLSDYGVETIEKGDNKLAKQVLTNINNFIATHPSYPYNAQEYLSDYDYYMRDYSTYFDNIVPKDTNDAYHIAYLRMDEYQSKEFSKNRTAFIAQLLYKSDNYYTLNWRNIDLDNPENFETTATASIATDKIGDYEYLVIIFVQKAKTPAAATD